MITTINNTDVTLSFQKSPAGYGQYTFKTLVTMINEGNSEIFNTHITDMEIVDTINSMISDEYDIASIEQYYFDKIFYRIEERVIEWIDIVKEGVSNA